MSDLTDAMLIGSGDQVQNEHEFVEWLGREGLHVLELGTMRWESKRPTHHAHWLPEGALHLKVDILPGDDVDMLADAHHLERDLDQWIDAHGLFDAVIAVSVWEHLHSPWIAAEQVSKVLRPGGRSLVMTHHTFPVHGYPHDYFRFTDEGLRRLFCPPLFSSASSAYAYPCKIIPPREVTRWNPSADAFLNVCCVATR